MVFLDRSDRGDSNGAIGCRIEINWNEVFDVMRKNAQVVLAVWLSSVFGREILIREAVDGSEMPLILFRQLSEDG